MNAAVRTPPARDRLLRAASEVFYREGLRSVGVDRVIERAEVTRATFYRHFPSKELLLVAYVQGLDRAVREHVGPVPGTPAESARWVRDFTRAIAGQLSGEGFRGCPFINAAAEYPDAAHPVRQAVTAHRDWLESSVATALGRAGHPDAEEGARRWLAQRDGAMVGGYLGSPAAAAATLVAAVDDLVGAR